MSQCVPNWDLDDNTRPPKNFFPSQSNSSAPQIPLFDYEVAELTWENGQLALHGLGPPRVPSKAVSSNQWEKPRAATVTGTLESIVNQATLLPTTTTVHKLPSGCNNELVSWLDHHQQPAISAASATLTNDALVPCSNKTDNSYHVPPPTTGCIVGSCSGPAGQKEVGKRSSRVARVPVGVNSTRSESVTFTNSFESQENTTSSGLPCTKETTATATADDYDSVSHSKPQLEAGDEGEKKKLKSSSSTKRSRAAAIHNQSERKRRDKINQKMKTLQKLVPNSSKTDKASMLDEVIEYLKQLQAQIQMMHRFNISPMMLPMAMQQQLQTMSMMQQQMNMGMGMGMRMNVMDLNSMARPNNIPGILHPNPFMPVPSWEGGDRLQTGTSAPVMPDPLAAFLACQSQQPMTMDAYSRMAAMYQQLHQQAAFNGSKKP